MDISGIIAAFGGTTWALAAFIISLSVIVAVHEYGHYIVGRWCGIKADVFSVGFGKPLFQRTDKHGTVWQLAALPFGGYVKFRGDANAASAGEDGEVMSTLSPEERRATMHGAPIWARALTVAAGPVFNFILSALIFAAFFMVNGSAKEPLTVAELSPMPVAVDLQMGDQITAVNGTDIASLEDIAALRDTLPRTPTLVYDVIRDGDQLTVEGPHTSPPLVVAVSIDSAAQDAGIEAGDVVLTIDGEVITVFDDMIEKVAETQGKPLALEVWRPTSGGNGEVLNFTLEPRATDERQAGGGFETNYRIGLRGGTFFEPVTEALSPVPAVTGAVSQVGLIIVSSLDGLWNIVTGVIGTCNLSGPVGIATTAGTMASLGASDFIWFIAFISTAVGLVNLFPIPILDGGHLVLHAYEAVRRRPPSARIMNWLMFFGLSVVLFVMVFGLANDIWCRFVLR
ncbi:MAG: RIP metalloprotease RseP [Rhodobacteraceae bacterium]|nr:RIP metalloprotease RseP [Paracoccaceae bacterium]